VRHAERAVQIWLPISFHPLRADWTGQYSTAAGSDGANTHTFSGSYEVSRFGPSLALKDDAAEWAVRIEEDQT
jgi:hypothetical protein